MHDRRKEAIMEVALRHAREMDDLMEGGLGAAREKFKALFRWCPDHIEDEEVRAEWEGREGKRGELPFFSEVFLYTILGKDEARSCLGRLRELGEALGFSSLELHGDLEAKPSKAEDLPTQDDLDALEVVMRDEASFLFQNPAEKIVQIQRAVRLMRDVLGHEPWREGVEYLRLKPGEVAIGDRIAQRGEWVEVHGYADPEDHLPDYVRLRVSEDPDSWPRPFHRNDQLVVQRKKA